MTTAPASLPDQLAAAEGGLPADIKTAIDEHEYSYGYVGEYPETRTILDATILARLTAAESAREALKAEIRDQAMKQLASDAGWELENDKLRAERDAALACAERAEKALDFYRSAVVTSATMEGLSYRGVSNSMFRHAWEADRAALTHPAPAEET